MNDGITWVVLTDGNYIKIMFNTARRGELKTLRDADFENTSEIAYKMVTRKRALTLNHQGKMDHEEEIGFFLKLIADFLQQQEQNNAFQNLLFIAPGDLTDRLSRYLPESINRRIIATVKDDYLPLTQDKLQEKLAGKI